MTFLTARSLDALTKSIASRADTEISFLRSELLRARQDYRELVDAAFRVRGLAVGPHVTPGPPPDWERAGGRTPTWDESVRTLEAMEEAEAEARRKAAETS